jgi:hypothetical protein
VVLVGAVAAPARDPDVLATGPRIAPEPEPGRDRGREPPTILVLTLLSPPLVAVLPLPLLLLLLPPDPDRGCPPDELLRFTPALPLTLECRPLLPGGRVRRGELDVWVRTNIQAPPPPQKISIGGASSRTYASSCKLLHAHAKPQNIK